MSFGWDEGYKKVLLYIILCASVLFALKYILPYFLPLVIALLIVVPLQRFCRRMEKKRVFKSNEKGIMAGGILFAVILIIIAFVIGIFTFLIGRAREALQNIDSISQSVSEIISDISIKIEESLGLDNGTVSGFLLHCAKSFNLTQTGNGILGGGIKYLSTAGHIGAFVLVSFVCAVLFAREIERWQQGLLSLAVLEPSIDKILSIIIRIGKKLGKMIKAYLKTQSIILICISATATIGLYIGGVREGWFYGILAGVMDFLPFIGTGIVLIPLALANFVRMRIWSGIAIIITYLACVLIREILEPRLLGDGLKFSPVAVLISVYAGVLFYGVGGVVLGPVTLLVFVELGREMFG